MISVGSRYCIGFLNRLRTITLAAAENDINASSNNRVLHVELNRPSALNALNLHMVTRLHSVLNEAAEDDKVGIVVLKGAGSKAFCAGGDVKAIRGGHPSESSGFFRQEYVVDYQIGCFQKPFISLLDGIAMGGGLGISVHGAFRVATERTVSSMPETLIGFYPDVGMGHVLARLPGHFGIYLGLTGETIKGANTYHAGLSTHFCSTQHLPTLVKGLESLVDPTKESVGAFLDEYHQRCIKDQAAFSHEAFLEDIRKHFSYGTVEEIVASLSSAKSTWAENTLKTLGRMSPLALKVTLKQLRGAVERSLKEEFELNFRMSCRFCVESDFYEGVQALLIDKGRSPNWKPPKLEMIEDSRVNSYFLPLQGIPELDLR